MIVAFAHLNLENLIQSGFSATAIAISLTPYQGLKRILVDNRYGRFIAISLTPYQGLKPLRNFKELGE
jgi:hypothetical protein